MEVFDVIKARRSVRSYSPEPVPEEVLTKILEAARLSPSAMNLQPWHFVVVKDPGRRQVLSQGRYAKFLTQSPVVIVGCGDKRRSPKWYAVDATIALQNMVLQATSEGLGTCWIGSFDPETVRSLLKVPESHEVVAMLALGYAKEKGGLSLSSLRPSRRKGIDRIVSREEFGATGL